MNSPALPFNTTLLYNITCPFSSKDLFGSYNYIQSSYCSQAALNSAASVTYLMLHVPCPESHLLFPSLYERYYLSL